MRLSWNGHDLADVNSGDSSHSTPVTLKDVTRQVKTVIDLLTKQLELLFHLMEERLQASIGRNDETSDLIQGSSRAPNHRSINNISVFIEDKWEELVRHAEMNQFPASQKGTAILF